MSWSPDLFIGELRPWPDSVHVVRGKTDEVRRYTPERKDGQEVLERRIDELCAELGKSQLNCDMWHDRAEDMRNRLSVAQAENAKLRMRVASLESALEGMHLIREIDMTENAKLREFAAKAWSLFIAHGAVHACDLSEVDAVRDGLRELGIEVVE